MPQTPDPTPAEIAERAAAIRATWDARTRRERGERVEPWHPPRVDLLPDARDRLDGRRGE